MRASDIQKATVWRAWASRSLKNVGEAGKTRQKQARKRLGSHSTLRAVNEHSEPVFNAVLPTQVVFQRPARHPRRSDRLQHSDTRLPVVRMAHPQVSRRAT